MAENTTQSVIQQAEQADPMGKPALWAGKTLRIIIVAALIIVAIFFGWKVYQWTRPAFSIDGKNYSSRSYNNMIKAAQAYNISKVQATKTYIDTERQRAAAKKAGIDVSDDLANAYASASNEASKRGNPSDWQKLLGYQQALNQTIQNLKTGVKSGYVLYFPFNRYIEQGYPPSSDPNFGKPSAIAADKTYAQQLADQYHAQLENGEAPEKLVAKLQKDKRLTLGNSLNPSAKFYYSLDTAQNKFGKDLAAPTINTMTASGLSAVVLIQSTSNAPTATGDVAPPADVTYIIVDLVSITKPDPVIESTFKAEVTKVLVKTNV